MRTGGLCAYAFRLREPHRLRAKLELLATLSTLMAPLPASLPLPVTRDLELRLPAICPSLS